MFKKLLQGLSGRSSSSPAVARAAPSQGDGLPFAFGYKTCWLCLPGLADENIKAALQYLEIGPAVWSLDLRDLFLTESVGDYRFLIGDLPLPHPDGGVADDPCLVWLGEASRKLGQVQLFCNLRTVDMYGWARAQDGSLERAFFSGELDLRVGAQTPQEQALGFNFFDPTCPEAASDAYWDRIDLQHVDEESVLAVAGAWSVNPTGLAVPAQGKTVHLTVVD